MDRNIKLLQELRIILPIGEVIAIVARLDDRMYARDEDDEPDYDDGERMHRTAMFVNISSIADIAGILGLKSDDFHSAYPTLLDEAGFRGIATFEIFGAIDGGDYWWRIEHMDEMIDVGLRLAKRTYAEAAKSFEKSHKRRLGNA